MNKRATIRTDWELAKRQGGVLWETKNTGFTVTIWQQMRCGDEYPIDSRSFASIKQAKLWANKVTGSIYEQ